MARLVACPSKVDARCRLWGQLVRLEIDVRVNAAADRSHARAGGYYSSESKPRRVAWCFA
eukprot:5888691-Pleurochrysis_carterae.AAC.1